MPKTKTLYLLAQLVVFSIMPLSACRSTKSVQAVSSAQSSTTQITQLKVRDSIWTLLPSSISTDKHICLGTASTDVNQDEQTPLRVQLLAVRHTDITATDTSQVETKDSLVRTEQKRFSPQIIPPILKIPLEFVYLIITISLFVVFLVIFFRIIRKI